MKVICFCLSATALIAAAAAFGILYFRYREWEKEQIRRARLWQKRAQEILEEAKKEIRKK